MDHIGAHFPKTRYRRPDGAWGISKEYRIWDNMISRAQQRGNNQLYRKYYRKIDVAEEWKTFKGFWSSMGSTYFNGASLDRIDSSIGYSKHNCRWINKKHQNMNTRRIKDKESAEKLINAGLTYRQASVILGFAPEYLKARLYEGKRLLVNSLVDGLLADRSHQSS